MISANVSAFSIGKAVGRGGGVPAIPFTAEHLTIAGGGGGGRLAAGGGGAGGYLTSTETLTTGVAYQVTVGAGGAQKCVDANGNPGSNSIFGSFADSEGGGYGAKDTSSGGSGGSGGGTGYRGGTTNGGNPEPGQGYKGGGAFSSSPRWGAGGGGGSAEVGQNGNDYGGGRGGNGAYSSITGTNLRRAAGGGGSAYWNGWSDGGAGGGGVGGGFSGYPPGNGTANTGSGGGGQSDNFWCSGSGGSGVIIISYPSDYTATFSAGVTSSTSTVGVNKVTTITAAGPSDTVTFG